MTYGVGKDTNETKFTIFKENCTSKEDVSDILKIVREMKGEADVFLNRTAIEGSSLVTKVGGLEGYSKGIISFCVKVEAMLSDISVAFLKTNVNLSYDLTSNTFEVNDNKIQGNTVTQTNTTVLTKYNVAAFRCSTDTYSRVNPSPVIKQGQLLAICLEPTEDSKSAVDISNFEMRFEQGGDEVLPRPAAIGSNGPLMSSLSVITHETQTYRVVARLVTALFDGGLSFNITGNAYFKFREGRNLLSSNGKELRSVQASPQNLAGESSFEMDIKIGKDLELNDNKTISSSILLSVVGATLALTVGFILFKKLG